MPRQLGHLSIGTVMIAHLSGVDAPLILWLLLAIQVFCWPISVLYSSHKYTDIKKIEVITINIDLFLTGIWIAISGFQVWIIASLFSMALMSAIALRGFSTYLSGFASGIIGALIAGIMTDFHVIMESSNGVITASSTVLFVASAVAGYMVYGRNIMLSIIRSERKKLDTQLNNLNRLFKTASSSIDFDELMVEIYPVFQEQMQFDTMVVMMHNDLDRQITPHKFYGKDISHKNELDLKKWFLDMDFEESIFKEIYQSGKPKHIDNVRPAVLNHSMDLRFYEIKPFLSATFIPILVQNESLCVLGFLSHYESIEMSQYRLNDLHDFVNQYSMLINNAILFLQSKQAQQEIQDKSNKLDLITNQLALYVPPQLYDAIFLGDRDVKLEASRKRLTIFFSDIAGFTSLTDKIESEVLTDMLNQYLSSMSEIALKYGGTIDKYIGDAIMVFFGDPQTKGVKEDALNCVRMAMEMQTTMDKLYLGWRKEGIADSMSVRMGINSGFCTVGNFGSDYRMDYTIIGGQVNLASRLQSSAKPGEILITDDTHLLIRDEIRCIKGEIINVKGIKRPIQTFLVDQNQESMVILQK